MSGGLELRGLTVDLGGRRVLDDVSLALDGGAYGVLLGPSGAGKSTLLRAVAGLQPCSGHVRIGDRVVCSGEQVVRPEERDVGFMFQGLALWPHMTVGEHLRFALRGRRIPAAEHAGRIADLLEVLGLTRLEGRHPGRLSGGERQRLALARALVGRPAVALLDEPTSSVDPETGRAVRELLVDLNERLGTTFLHVTHDQAEALALGSRVFVIEAGRLLQGGTPEEVYRRPTSRRAAAFLGEGGILPGTVREDGRADTPLGVVPCEGPPDGGAVWLLARPGDLAAVSEGEGVPAAVRRVTYAGGSYHTQVELGGYHLVLELAERVALDARLRVRVVRPLWSIEERIET